MSQRLILTALKSARLNGVPFRVRKTEKRRKRRQGENKMGESAERRHGDGDGEGAEKNKILRSEQSRASGN